jgi:S1-C subfamily serine protease
MRKRFAFATAIVFAVAIIMMTLPSTAAVAQQQQINSNISSFQSTNSSFSNPLPLKTIFKQVENSVVQITSKVPTTTGIPNPSNQPSSNVTTLGSGFIYDKQGHIVTNGHVVGNAQIVDVTFPNGNRYTGKVIGSDIYSDIAVLHLCKSLSIAVILAYVLTNN